MNANSAKRWLSGFTWLAGLSDSSTGLLLIFAPTWTFSLMRVALFPVPVFASYLGVFVLGVGLAYFYAAAQPLRAATLPRWETVWWMTALSRTLVATFIVWKCLTRELDAAWLSVAATDGALAAVQWLGLARGWLRKASES